MSKVLEARSTSDGIRQDLLPISVANADGIWRHIVPSGFLGRLKQLCFGWLVVQPLHPFAGCQ